MMNELMQNYFDTMTQHSDPFMISKKQANNEFTMTFDINTPDELNGVSKRELMDLTEWEDRLSFIGAKECKEDIMIGYECERCGLNHTSLSKLASDKFCRCKCYTYIYFAIMQNKMGTTNEKFIKIGTTINPQQREKNLKYEYGAYSVKILGEISVYRGHAVKHAIFALLHDFKYQPILSDVNHMECFTMDCEDKVVDMLNIVKHNRFDALNELRKYRLQKS